MAMDIITELDSRDMPRPGRAAMHFWREWNQEKHFVGIARSPRIETSTTARESRRLIYAAAFLLFLAAPSL